MNFHPDVLAAHAEFGGNLELMQKCYEHPDLVAEVAKLRTAMKEACDLLAERIHGNAARSPGHNARLTLETALYGAPAFTSSAKGCADA